MFFLADSRVMDNGVCYDVSASSPFTAQILATTLRHLEIQAVNHPQESLWLVNALKKSFKRILAISCLT